MTYSDEAAIKTDALQVSVFSTRLEIYLDRSNNSEPCEY